MAATSASPPLPPPVCARMSTSSTMTLFELRPSAHAMSVVKDNPRPRDVILSVDLSYSMTGAANDRGEGTIKNFSKLDLVKHAASAVVESLGDNDRLGVTWFSERSGVVAPLTRCTEQGKKSLRAKINAMQEIGCTNIWAGLVEALNMARGGNATIASSDHYYHPDLRGDEVDDDGDTAMMTTTTSSSLNNHSDPSRCRRVDVLLLTDGHANESPPEGEEAALKNFLAAARDSSEDSKWIENLALSTFGLGYDLDSTLLTKLAQVGRGSYAFIPDGGMVGTIIINALATASTTVVSSARLRVRPADNGQMMTKLKIRGGQGLNAYLPGGEAIAWIGDIRQGQTRHVLIESSSSEGGEQDNFSSSSSPSSLRVSLLLPGGEEWDLDELVTHWPLTEAAANGSDQKRIQAQVARAEFTEGVPAALSRVKLDLSSARTAMMKVMDRVEAADPSAPQLEDMSGQIAEALSREEYWNRWGQHYIPSLHMAHVEECTNNFKDKGVQAYASPEFEAARDIIDTIFNNLEPPKPSRIPTACRSAQYVSAAVFSAGFNHQGNGCFGPNTQVKTTPTTSIRIADLKKGDVVLAPGAPNGVAKVLCITRHHLLDDDGDDGESSSSSKAAAHKLVTLNGTLKITPWHPVRVNGQWSFPAWLAPVSTSDNIDVVYNVVLAGDPEEHGGRIIVDGTDACVLGHGLKDDIVRHKYFGTNAVICDLALLPGFENGIVDVYPSDVHRDRVTNRVKGFRSDDAPSNSFARVAVNV